MVLFVVLVHSSNKYSLKETSECLGTISANVFDWNIHKELQSTCRASIMCGELVQPSLNCGDYCTVVH